MERELDLVKQVKGNAGIRKQSLNNLGYYNTPPPSFNYYKNGTPLLDFQNSERSNRPPADSMNSRRNAEAAVLRSIIDVAS